MLTTTKLLATTKPRKCSQCGTLFAPLRAMAKVCSPICAYKLVKTSRAAEKVALKKRKADSLTPAQRRERTQVAVNESVRWRAHKLGCISCGTHTGVMHAGHYRSVKAAPHLRFDARNIHKQCAQCNLFESGNLIMYRLGFVTRYGVAAVDAVECDNSTRHYLMDDLDVIRLDAITLTKQLKKEIQ